MQFWPILGLMNGSPNAQPFVIGIFSGERKPDSVNEYFEDFIRDVSELKEIGLQYNQKLYQVKISTIICDTPARAYVKCVKGHTAYHGCDKCTQHGLYLKKMTFPTTNAPNRTDVAFHNQMDEDHHKDETPLRNLGIGLVSQFPLDYMHLVCLGVMKKLILIWLKGPLTVRVGTRVKKQISEAVIHLRPYMPREFARKPRTLDDVERWKATEFRLFLLYTGMIVLHGNVAQEVYDNFLLLVASMHILASPRLSSFTDHAKELLVSFVEHFGKLYGATYLTYNVHALIHLPDDVAVHGPDDKFSAFPFENCLGKIKRQVRKPKSALKQTVRRLYEAKQFCNLDRSKAQIPNLKGSHSGGPVPDRLLYTPCQEYCEISAKNFTINRSHHGDKVIRVCGKIAVVRNIFQCRDDIYIVYNKFRRTAPLFQYPVDSAFILCLPYVMNFVHHWSLRLRQSMFLCLWKTNMLPYHSFIPVQIVKFISS